MWAPGAYLPNRTRATPITPTSASRSTSSPPATASSNRIKEHRNTVILPERTGPIADVLYSAGGNSADEHWYNRGIIAYSFETGADRYVNTTLSAASAAGARRSGPPTGTTTSQGDKITVDAGTANEETARRLGRGVQPSRPPRTSRHGAAGERPPVGECWRRHGPAGVGFQPAYATEGKHEALEFAPGTTACSSRHSNTHATTSLPR